MGWAMATSSAPPRFEQNVHRAFHGSERAAAGNQSAFEVYGLRRRRIAAHSRTVWTVAIDCPRKPRYHRPPEEAAMATKKAKKKTSATKRAAPKRAVKPAAKRTAAKKPAAA